MLVHELILDQFDIGYESIFDLDEFLQCLGGSEFENMNYQKLIWIKNEFFLEKNEMI